MSLAPKSELWVGVQIVVRLRYERTGDPVQRLRRLISRRTMKGNMRGLHPVFRVFFASTFSDFTAERDALQRRVFPSLREHCRERGASFVPIDLRWGVSDAASRDQLTLRIC